MKLTYYNLLRRRVLVNQEECLIHLENSQLATDRVRRVYFDRVEAVAVWKTVPWVRMWVAVVLIAGPGVLLQMTGDVVGHAIGWTLIAVGFAMAMGWAVCRKTHILIRRAGKAYQFVVMARPGRITRFRSELRESIHRIQHQPETDTPTALDLPFPSAPPPNSQPPTR